LSDGIEGLYHEREDRAQAERRKAACQARSASVFLLARVAEKDDITMPELAAELVAATGTKVEPASLSR